MYVDACCNDAGTGELVSLMPKFATAHSLSDYPKLTIQQVKSRLSPEIKQIYLPFKRSGELFNQSKSAKRLAIMAVIAIGLSVATAKGVLVCCIVMAISNVGIV